MAKDRVNPLLEQQKRHKEQEHGTGIDALDVSPSVHVDRQHDRRSVLQKTVNGLLGCPVIISGILVIFEHHAAVDVFPEFLSGYEMIVDPVCLTRARCPGRV